ncbi:MAG: alpha/beta hydrolase [Candidatus Fimadaptatus sp.]|jgi:putative tributyrin esterase
MALIHANFFSEALGMCVSCDVVLPQRATRQIGMAAAASEGAHPTLWLLHGASDDHTIWQRRTSIERYAAPLGLAVVMPAVSLSSYANMAHGGRYFDYVAEELPRIMRSMFPLSDKREDNYIAGLSMGGAGCMKIGLAKPNNYAAIGCFSAGAINRHAQISPERAARMEMTYGTTDIDALKGTVEDVLGSARRILDEGLPCPRIFHSIGTEDFLLDSAHETRDFFRSLPGNPFDYHYEEHPGAHTWEYWDEHIQDFLRFIGRERVDGIRN